MTETTFKGEKAKVAYSAEEAYQLYKKPLVDSYIKGEKPDYRYIQLAYATNKSWDKVEDEIDKIIAKNYDSNDNFYSIEHQLSYCFNNRKDNNIKYMDIDVYSDERIKEFKKLYNAAQDILNSINIDSFEEDYEKIVALNYWFSNNCRYGDCPYNSFLDAEKGIIYKHVGACTEHTLATNYFCALMKIPSVRTADFSGYWNHEWNFIKIGSKWYNVDNLNGVVLVGTDTLASLHQKHKIFGLEGKDFEPWKSRLSKTDISITKEKDNEIRIKIGLDPID